MSVKLTLARMEARVLILLEIIVVTVCLAILEQIARQVHAICNSKRQSGVQFGLKSYE